MSAQWLAEVLRLHDDASAAMSEPLITTRPMKITPDETPAPPWSGHAFYCEKCQALNQLEAGDVCMTMVEGRGQEYLTPACPTRGCGHRSRIQLPKEEGENAERPTPNAESRIEEEDWNAS
jgi:hypothetical protein